MFGGNNYEDYWLDIKLLRKSRRDYRDQVRASCLFSLSSSPAEDRINQSNWFPLGPKARRAGAGRGGGRGGGEAEPPSFLLYSLSRIPNQSLQRQELVKTKPNFLLLMLHLNLL